MKYFIGLVGTLIAAFAVGQLATLGDIGMYCAIGLVGIWIKTIALQYL